MGVPIIDLLQLESVPEKIVEACEEWGYFRLINHGISKTLMSEMKTVARSLLDLPSEIKLKTAHPVPGNGYTPCRMPSPLFESLGVYDFTSPGVMNNFFNQLAASPLQREIIMKYSHAVHDLAQDLGCKLKKGLGLRNGDLFKGWAFQFRVIKYHFSPETVGATGATLHTDPVFLTILQDDEVVNGLEIMNNAGQLAPIDPMPGSFIVNVGDIAKAWSNGRFCNVKHRVQCKEARIRISTAMFVLGPRDEMVEASQELVDSKHPRLYAPFHFEDYRSVRFSKRWPTDEALQLFCTTNS